MSLISEVLPVWVIEEEKPLKSCRQKQRTKEKMQKIKIRVNYLRNSQNSQLKSPDFHLKRLNNSSWYLTIDSKVKEINSGIDYISVYLHLRERANNYGKFNGEIAKFQITFIHSNGNKTISKMSGHFYFCGLFGWGWKYFMKRSAFLQKFSRIHSNTNELNLVLGISLTEVKDLNEKNELENEFYDDLSRDDINFEFNHDLMNDKEYCDIRFIFEDSDFKAHSRLLASKSSIFKSMFTVNKSSENEIFITEFDAEVFYELITFIYKGYAPNIEKYCDKLLIAANYYEISRLKSMCDGICFRKLTPEIAIDAINFALKYNAFSVKVRTISYIAINLKEIIKSSQVKWETFKKDNKVLVKEILAIRRMKCGCIGHEFII